MPLQLRISDWLVALSAALLFCLTAGCQFDPWAVRFLTARPSESDVVGTYKVDSDSLKRHIVFGMDLKTLFVSPDAQIILSANHDAHFFRVPDTDENEKQSCSITGDGSWRLFVDDQHYVVVLVRIVVADRDSADGCGPIYNGSLNFYGKRPPYKLHITIGDPDSGDAVQFEKVK